MKPRAMSEWIVPAASIALLPRRSVHARVPRVEVREQAFEIVRLPLQLRVARLRLLPDALEPPLDVIAVGDEQLELQRLQVVVRHPRAGEPVEDDEERVDLTQLAEQLRTGAAHLHHANGGRRDLARLHD